MADPSSIDTIMEEREELMVSPTGGNPTLRAAHFLNPTLTSVRDLPSLSLSSHPTISEVKKTPLKVRFNGLQCPQKGWETWVEHLQPAYQYIWKKTGIYDAILASTYHTMRHTDLVIGLAQRWCVETNTFIFPWGEATITLEDMVVLGGYSSVLGYSVLNPLKTLDLIEIQEHLSKAHMDVRLGIAQITSHYAWMNHFMDSGDQFEHEAFLVLWLSRYVFPSHCEVITRNVFPIAIHLSRGTPIALAPAVLAAIYRDLSLLKKYSMIALTKLGTNCECEGGVDALTLTLRAPLHLVHLWAWERFPNLRPNPNPIRCGEPRLSRWHRLKRLKVENVGVGMAMDSAGECFLWRPYATVVNNWTFRKFYRECEEWVLVKSDMDKELESFARCLRACELVGLDCIEQYLPHRVAMQFGMDQDLPGYVTRSNETSEIAWRNYIRPIKDAELYIPYRLFESDVTKRYSEWWKQSMLACQDAIKCGVRQQHSKTCKRLPRGVFRGHWNDNHDFFPSKCVKVEDVDEDKLTITEILRHYDFVPSGFPSKRVKVEDVDEDKLTIAEKLRRCVKHNSFGDRTASDHKWRLKASFHGWRDPQRKWKSWVDQMHSLHQSTWKKAGICEAVMGSTYPIRVNNDLVFGIAERWCSETNTFLFPWGEATITLEDMMVLGGFSVLGASSVSMPLQAQELVKIEENLNQVRIGLGGSKSHKAEHCVWIKYFMQSGNEFEHEAFLSLWLSRFVFPGNVFNTICKHVFPIAIHLARGTRIALAPAVLASLYRDLSLLKETIVASTELEEEANANEHDTSLAVTLWAPLRLAQCWAWERLPPLRPQPNAIKSGEPRMARWHFLKRSNFENVRRAIDSAGEIFQWRPYVTAVHGLTLPKFYKEKEEWVSNNLSLDEELESFARCLRACELVGLDCREHYLPYRVAMQFGMDQDHPGWVPHSNATPEMAWNNYSKPVSNAKQYIPSRLFELDVTTRYLKWWKEVVFVPQDAIKGIVQRKRSPRRWKRLSQTSKEMKGGNEFGNVEADKHALVGIWQTTSNDKPLFDTTPSQSLSSLASDDGASMRTKTKPIQQIMHGEFATKISETGIEIAHNIDSNKSNEEGNSRDFTFRLPELELEARILKLEREVAELKAAEFGNQCVK